MEHLTGTMVALAISGLLMHMLMFVSSKTKGGNKFSFKAWRKDSMNWIRLTISLISTFALLLMLDDVAALFGVSIEGHGGILKLVAFVSGYFNHSLIKNILRVFRKATKTSDIV